LRELAARAPTPFQMVAWKGDPTARCPSVAGSPVIGAPPDRLRIEAVHHRASAGTCDVVLSYESQPSEYWLAIEVRASSKPQECWWSGWRPSSHCRPPRTRCIGDHGVETIDCHVQKVLGFVANLQLSRLCPLILELVVALNPPSKRNGTA